MTDEQAEAIAGQLAKLSPGFLPYPIFEQIARLVALPIIEFIPLRRHDGRIEVLLIDRGPDDPLFPNLLHTPGTVIRATDLATDKQQPLAAFSRILHDELKDTAVGRPQYVDSIFHASKRGAEQAQLYWIEVLGEPGIGAFYDVKQLPANLIESQREFILQAASAFERTAPEQPQTD